jgi:hypothetical protein
LKKHVKVDLRLALAISSPLTTYQTHADDSVLVSPQGHHNQGPGYRPAPGKSKSRSATEFPPCIPRSNRRGQ